MAIGKSMHIKVDDGDILNRHVHYSEAPFPNSDGKDAPPWDFKPIPTEPLHSLESYEAERDKIFRKRWINIAREWEVPEPGSYIIKNIDVLGASIIVLRGIDSVIRCFHNVCPHRGNQLFDPNKLPCQGRTRTVMCAFHGWTYDLEGKCLKISDEGKFYDLNKNNISMMKIHTDTWKGQIFVNLSEQPTETLEQWLGDFGKELNHYDWDRFEVAAKWEAEVNVNYKVFIDAFQETYHVSFIHLSSFTGEIEGDTDPYFNLKYMRFFGPHKALAVPARGSPETNVRQKVIKQDGENVREGINLDGIEDWGFDIDVVFPNFFFNMLNNQYFTHNFWPVGPHKTHWECHLYLPRTDKASDLITWEREKCLLRDAINEDLSTNEATQVSIKNGHIKHLHYSEQETALRHHYYYMEQLTK